MAQPSYSRQQLQRAAAADAKKYGLGDWFSRQIGQESGWDPNAHSGAGADGIAQFIPSTAKAYGLTNTRDPIASLDAAARYDASLLKQFGSVPRALSAYNSGKPDAYRDPNFAGGQTYNYVRDIVGGKTAAAPIDPGFTANAPAAVKPNLTTAAAKTGAVTALPDFGAQLQTDLLHAAATPTNDLTGFYGTLGKKISAQLAQAAAAHPAAGPPAPMTGRGAAVIPGASLAAADGLAGGFLASGATYKPGRLDQGHDFQTDPGRSILSPGDGVVVSVKSDPHGFGPAYPIIRFTSGRYAGKPPLYVGHTLTQLKPGQRVTAGQVISRTGTTPVGNATVPGWAEIGYAPGGVPGSFGQHAPF